MTEEEFMFKLLQGFSQEDIPDLVCHQYITLLGEDDFLDLRVYTASKQFVFNDRIISEGGMINV